MLCYAHFGVSIFHDSEHAVHVHVWRTIESVIQAKFIAVNYFIKDAMQFKH